MLSARSDCASARNRATRMSKRIVTSKRRTVVPAERPRAIPKKRKREFDLDDMIARIRVAVAPFPKAAMFELAERGYDSVFHVLVGCIISIRTLDEVSPADIAETVRRRAHAAGDRRAVGEADR